VGGAGCGPGRLQVRGQQRELAEGAGDQRDFEALIQLLGGEPAVASRDPEDLDDPVPVGMGSPQLRPRRLTAGTVGWGYFTSHRTYCKAGHSAQNV